MEKFKTIIIGAGPSGLRCAKILAGHKEDFLLLEARPKIGRKICTGFWGINNQTNYFRLPEYLFKRKFNKVLFKINNKILEIETEKPFSAVLDRRELGEWMLSEIEYPAKDNIRFGQCVSFVGDDYIITGGEKIYFDYLVGADGSNSIVRKYLGIDNKKIGLGMQYWVKSNFENLEIYLNPDKFSAWYGWVVPCGEKTSIGTGCDISYFSPKQMKENLEKWCREMNIDMIDSVFESAPINYDYQGWRFGNKFLAGDAAGFASGLSGEGMFFGMASGEDIAKTIINKNYNPLLIKKVLKVKKKHEIILKILKINKYSTKLIFNLWPFFFKIKKFKAAIIELFV